MHLAKPDPHPAVDAGCERDARQHLHSAEADVQPPRRKSGFGPNPDMRPLATPSLGLKGRVLGGQGSIWKDRKRTGTFGVV